MTTTGRIYDLSLLCKHAVEIINALGVSADMLLADVVDTGYQTKESLLSEKLEGFPLRERERIYAVIETMLRYAEEERPVE